MQILNLEGLKKLLKGNKRNFLFFRGSSEIPLLPPKSTDTTTMWDESYSEHIEDEILTMIVFTEELESHRNDCDLTFCVLVYQELMVYISTYIPY